jgi:DhnA family fructose-bisphosphate aldolase class Ia
MQKLVLAVTLLIALGAVAISGSLYAGHKSTNTMTSAMDPTALTLKAKDLPLVQVNEPF